MLSKPLQMLIEKISGIDAPHVESIALSLIDINLISVSDKGHNDPTCREKMLDFLGRKGYWKSIDQLFIDTLGPHSQDFKHLSWVEMTDILQGKRSIVMEGGHRLFGTWYHFNSEQGLYLDLQESIILNKDAIIDRDFFAYFFAYRLSKKTHNEVHKFLIVALVKHFDNQVFELIDFCRHEIIPNYRRLLGKNRIEMIRSFIKKIQNKAPYTRAKTIQIKTKPLNEFFTDGYDGTKCAELFRIHVVHRILKNEGKPVTGIKRKIRFIADLLITRHI